MELYQIRTFLTVADEGHLKRAAEKLFTSQSAVTPSSSGPGCLVFEAVADSATLAVS